LGFSYRTLSGKSRLIDLLQHMTQTLPKPQKTRKFKTVRTITALILREMGTTYGRSPGGYIWAILEPVGAITLFTVVISLGLKLKSPSIGTSFMLFYATGFLPFAIYGQTANKIAKSLKYSRQLLKYPGVRFTDTIIARFLLNILTQLMVVYVIMSGIRYAFDVGAILNMPAILLSLTMAAFFGLGVGLVNCFLSGVFPVWEQIWSIITRPLFLLSTVIYTFEEVPWQYQDVVWYNPLVHIIGMMRRGFYPIYDAAYASPVYVFGVSLVCIFFGLLLLSRWYRRILVRA
jgi:capsular polysaccharide transport system permease protein